MAPGPEWSRVINTYKNTVVIINPASGPSTNPGPLYASFLQQFAAAGITVVGYVDSARGTRTADAINADIDIYANQALYPGLNGIFLDDVPSSYNDAVFAPVFTHITTTRGWAHAILNPGVQPDVQYLAVSTNLLIFEDNITNWSEHTFGSAWNPLCAPDAASKATYQNHFSGMAENVLEPDWAHPSGEYNAIQMMHSVGIGWVYVTDVAYATALASYYAIETSMTAGTYEFF